MNVMASLKSAINENILRKLDIAIVQRSGILIEPTQQIRNVRIAFIHPPKCGGTSINRALSGRFGKNSTENARRSFHLNARGSRKVSEAFGQHMDVVRGQLLAYALCDENFSFISGHFPFVNNVDDISIKNVENISTKWDYITVLRNPYDRMLSLYYDNAFRESDRDHFGISQPLEEWLETVEARGAATIFVRMFNGNVCENVNIEKDLCDTEHLKYAVERSIKNLKKFSIVGDMKELGEFKKSFHDKYGLLIDIGHHMRNPKDDYTEFERQPTHIQDKIVKLCHEDREISSAFFKPSQT